MIDIRKDSETIEKSSAEKEFAIEDYFTCESRAEVLPQMLSALQKGVELMVLT